ncbi:MAG TPA: hypothetical protein VHX65_15615 [Pirellulales bacterium]|jgi:hypothetical protein|nr:hypothetical protein [Pirellulales bacterium]
MAYKTSSCSARVIAACLAACLAVGLFGVGAIAAESLESPSSVPQAASASPKTKPSVAGRLSATGKPVAKAVQVLITPEREAAALQFVREHHPELVELLKNLKISHSAQYQAALRQLFQTSERLARIHETDPPRYELELKLWKIKSRIQLLAARSSMSNDPELAVQLKAALEEQAQVQLAELQLERDRVAERLKTLDSSVEQFKANRQRNIDKQFEKLMADINHRRLQTAARQAESTKERPAANAVKPSVATKSARPTTPTSSAAIPPTDQAQP